MSARSFPPARMPRSSPFRTVNKLYNLALTKAFETAGGAQVELRSGAYELPFGRLEVTFDQDQLVWGDLRLTEFAPAAELEVRGLRNRYRRPGLGAPLAAAATALKPIEGFQVAARQRAPVTVILRIEDARRALADGQLQGSLELYTPTDPEEVTIAGRAVPLEVEPTASLAYGLEGAPIWKTEYSGFLFGDLLQQTPTQLAALQPHRAGRFPVVLVHGTASSAARWAEVVNDLSSDPRIRDRFEFWFFSYETGNPIPYSALQLRRALEQAVASLDPTGEDTALRDMVLIGHSQGGLLVKMAAVDTDARLWDAISTEPLDQLRVQAETRELLQQSLFLEPEPFVGRVIFVATPHRGSYLAEYSLGSFIAGFVRLPFNLLRATGDVLTNNPDAFRFDPQRARVGSIYGMTPGSPLITGLADIPVAPGIPAHSIIAVRGDEPVEGRQRRCRAIPERAHRGRGVGADRALGALCAGQPAHRARAAPDSAAACGGGLPGEGHWLLAAAGPRERGAVRPGSWLISVRDVATTRTILAFVLAGSDPALPAAAGRTGRASARRKGGLHEQRFLLIRLARAAVSLGRGGAWRRTVRDR